MPWNLVQTSLKRCLHLERSCRHRFHIITAFNALAESCANYVDRGRLLAVQGRVQTREYEDREGTKHQVMQVVAEKVTFLGAAKREDDDQRPSPGKPRNTSRSDDPDPDDVPF